MLPAVREIEVERVSIPVSQNVLKHQEDKL